MTILVIVAAVLVVLGTSLLKNVDWPDKTKHFIAVALSLVAGVVGLWATGQLDGATDVAAVVTLIYGAAQAFYGFIFKGTVLDSFLSETAVLGGNKDEVEVPEPDEVDPVGDHEVVEDEVVDEEVVQPQD